MRNQLFLCLAAASILTACSDSSGKESKENHQRDSQQVMTGKSDTAVTSQGQPTIADAATILARKQVPILCYHHIRNIQMPSKAMNGYEVTEAAFKAQMKALSDSGYKSVLPDQLYDYLTKGTPLPEKPVMITYDDTHAEHFTIAKQEMDKYGFKGVFYIMTIAIDKQKRMTKEQIKQLSDEGHAIGSHTWDHHRVDKLKNENEIEFRGKKMIVNEWDFQLANSRKQLEEITGKPVVHFAYPFGIWSKEAIPELEKRGYKSASILSTVRDSTQPLFTIRRMIVAPTWSAEGMLRVMKSTFK